MLTPRSIFPALLKVAAAVALSAVALCAAVPRGWYLAGSKPQDYQTGVNDAQYNGHRVAYLQSLTAAPNVFGTLMQDFRADDYAGKRVRFSAMLKAESVADWAGLWMRIDKNMGSSAPKMLVLDNMHDRPVKGTEDWKMCQVVLDVPKDATGIYFGLTLNGSGNVMMSEAKIETVGLDIQPTAKPAPEQPRPAAPTNLDFAP
ncbi:MAG TPA: hypothetical protein VGJ06_00475 [Candidatus Acidoferrum sp.]|jgi:hypothetical protein